VQNQKIEDPEWKIAVARILRWTRAKIVAVYFKGANSFAFQAAGLIHPLLRTLMLPRELLNKRLARLEACRFRQI